jgi:hypothetical protein
MHRRCKRGYSSSTSKNAGEAPQETAAATHDNIILLYIRNPIINTRNDAALDMQH